MYKNKGRISTFLIIATLTSTFFFARIEKIIYIIRHFLEEGKRGKFHGYNWNDEVLRTAISHNHNVSINGGSEKTQYSASMSYQNKQGIVRGTDFERFGGRAFLQTKALNDRLTLAFNVNAAQSKGTTVDSA